MSRLFVNLYLVIIVGLLSINWLSEQLWQQFVESEPPVSQQWHQLEQVAKVLPLLLKGSSQPNKLIMSKLSKTLNAPIITAPMSDYSWLEEQKSQLMLGKVILNYDEQDNVIFYVKSLYKSLFFCQIQYISKLGHQSLFHHCE